MELVIAPMQVQVLILQVASAGQVLRELVVEQH